MTEIEKVLYAAKTHTSGGREGGVSRSSDGRLDVTFTPPGAAGSGTNPERLFAAGWSACLISAMKIAAGKMKVALLLTWLLTPKWTSAQRTTPTDSQLLSTSACRVWNAKSLSALWKPRTSCVHTPTPHAATSMLRSTWSEQERERTPA